MTRALVILVLTTTGCLSVPQHAASVDEVSDSGAMLASPGGGGGAGGDITFAAPTHADSISFDLSGGMGGSGTPPGASGETGTLFLADAVWAPALTSPRPESIVSTEIVNGSLHFAVGDLGEGDLNLMFVGTGTQLVVDILDDVPLHAHTIQVERGGQLRFAALHDPEVCQGTLCFSAGTLETPGDVDDGRPLDITLRVETLTLHGVIDQSGRDTITGADGEDGAEVTVYTTWWDMGRSGGIVTSGGDGGLGH